MNDLAQEESSFLKEKHKISSQNFFLWPGHICERYILQKMGENIKPGRSSDRSNPMPRLELFLEHICPLVKPDFIFSVMT